MSDRITNADIDQALERLARALRSVGWEAGYERALDLRQPYGQIYYVVSYEVADRAAFWHDVPGFKGSGGSGFTSKRQAYEAINQAARLLFDLADWAPARIGSRGLMHRTILTTH